MAVFLLALVLTGWTRFAALDLRPMHTDEAVQADIYLAPMLSGQGYSYRGADGHGPLLVYSTRVLCALTGTHTYRDLTTRLLRLTPALYSLGIVLALLLMTDGIGRRATMWAALLTAVSPIGVYYSRYYIMEVPLVFFTTVAIATGWRYAVSRNPAWLAATGVAVGLMHVSKETFLIQMIAGTLAIIATQTMEYFLSGTGYGQINRRTAHSNSQLAVHIVLAVLVAGGVSFILYSAFFTKPGQFFDSLKSYVDYSQRAQGAGHEKPWWYYLQLLFGRRDADGFFSGEWPVLGLAIIGGARAFLAPPTRYENKRLQRFLVFYAVALLAGYSMIRYKTPWTILGAEQAIVLLAGMGVAALLAVPWGNIYRSILSMLLLATVVYLVGQVWRQNFRWPADDGYNPYVYSHTSPDVLRLVNRVEEAAGAHGNPSAFAVFVIHPESGYPLPWYFRRFAGGATTEMPEDSQLLSAADVIVTTPEAAPLIAALVSSTHRELQETYLLRPGSPLRALFRRSLLGDLPKAPPLPATEPPAAAPPPEAPPSSPPAETPSAPDPAVESEPAPVPDPGSTAPEPPAIPLVPPNRLEPVTPPRI